MKLDVRTVDAVASRVFAVDPPRLRLGREDIKVLQERLHAISVDVQASERPLMNIRTGKVPLSPTRTVPVQVLTVADIELGVSCPDSTGDAIDVLQEIWTWLGEITGATEEDLNSAPGSWVYRTRAVIVAPGLLNTWFRGIERIRAALTDPSLQVEARETFRIEIQTRRQIHGLLSDAAFTIEPRLVSKSDEHVFFTQSPLTSEQHLSVLRDLVEHS